PPHGSASAEAAVRVTAPGTGDGDGGVGGGLPARHGPSRNGEAVPRRHALPGQVEPFLGSSRKVSPSRRGEAVQQAPTRRGGSIPTRWAVGRWDHPRKGLLVGQGAPLFMGGSSRTPARPCAVLR